MCRNILDWRRRASKFSSGKINQICKELTRLVKSWTMENFRVAGGNTKDRPICLANRGNVNIKISAVDSKWPSFASGPILSITSWYTKVLHGWTDKCDGKKLSLNYRNILSKYLYTVSKNCLCAEGLWKSFFFLRRESKSGSEISSEEFFVLHFYDSSSFPTGKGQRDHEAIL